MSVYITSEEVRHELIDASFTRQSRDPGQPAPIFDTASYETAINPFLLKADNIYLSLTKKKELDVADIPTYAEGMTQEAIDMLTYYVWYRYFEKEATIATTQETADPKKQAAKYFEDKFKTIYNSISIFDLTNDTTTEPKTNSNIGLRSDWL